MRKLFTILVLFTTFVTLNAQLSVIYFTKDKTLDVSAGADPVLAMLQADTRFTVTVNKDVSIAAPDLSSYDLVVMSEAVASGDVIVPTLKGINNRFLNMKVYAFKAGVWDWAEPGEGATVNVSVVAGQEGHAIFAGCTIANGLIATFKRLADDSGTSGTKANNYGYGYKNVTGNVIRLGYPEGAAEADAANIFVVDDPAASIGGTTIPKKYATLGFNYGAQVADGATNFTEDGLRIVKNTIEWLVKDLLPSNVTNTLSKHVNAYGMNGYIRIILDEPSHITIYSIDGKIVKETTIHSSTSFPCRSGLYIVKVAGAGMTKVFVTR